MRSQGQRGAAGRLPHVRDLDRRVPGAAREPAAAAALRAHLQAAAQSGLHHAGGRRAHGQRGCGAGLFGQPRADQCARKQEPGLGSQRIAVFKLLSIV